MNGVFSRSAGVLVLPGPGTHDCTVIDLVGGEKQDPLEAQYLYSAVQDWEDIDGSDMESLVTAGSHEYWVARSVSLLRLAIGGLERSLERRVLAHVEEILGSRVSSGEVINRLLVAPLADPDSPRAPCRTALTYGLAAVASVLDETADIQPLLQRFCDHWLGLPGTVFSQFTESREAVWLTVVEKARLAELLRARGRSEFTTTWNLLAFHFPEPGSRSGVESVGQRLSGELFPDEEPREGVTDGAPAERERAPRDGKEPATSAREAFEKVKRQISAIAEAVSRGQDAKATKFLRELINQQTSLRGGEGYAVKSLCNIGKRCADMFRTDFEADCLAQAIQLAPSDAWALIQYGDHLKRAGKYDEALKVFAQAEQLGEGELAQCCTADVFSQQGDYARAIRAYEAVPGFRQKPEILTAIADNLRRMGRMHDAGTAYAELIRLAKQGRRGFARSVVRAKVGLAEIAKREGRLDEALGSYREILSHEGIDDRDRLVYGLGLCNVLKLKEQFQEAYVVVDGIIQDFPFAMEARFLRGSILGLCGREDEGLKDVFESPVSRSWREWLRRYYRGLLLFKLERYEDAKKNLVEELPNVIASAEEKAVLSMAAALWFLSRDETVEADGLLSTIPDLHDCHARYLSLVLRLHSAARREDVALMDSLRKQIADIRIVDQTLERAVTALWERGFSIALSYEVDALLKLAA